MPDPLPEDVGSIVDALLPLVRSLASGDYGIALGGSYAKGGADAESDVDLYLFTASAPSEAERERIAREFSPEIEDLRCWNEPGEFRHAGTDFRFRGRPVEIWLRNPAWIDDSIDECERGVVRQEFQTWTTTGFYNHCCLNDVNVMVPLEDPAGILARWKERVATYPRRLREEIVRRHLGAAAFWPDSFHYLSAVERADAIYVSGIVQQVVHNLIQVVFAANERYFPGDKKLEEVLDRLPRGPERFRERVCALLWPGAPGTRAVLRAQGEELRALLAEVRELVAE